MKRLAFLFIALYLLVQVPAVQAQSIPSASGGLVISSSLANPAPGQTVTLTAASYTIDLGAATISWSANGKVLGKGVGLNKITVQAPDAGKRLTVSVNAISSGGIEINSSISLTSGSVDLIIEPGGYVPPFFHGKAGVAYQNSVKIVAIPHLSNTSGIEYDPKTLVYKWEQGSNVLQEQSGYGRQSVTIPGNIVPRPYLVTVTVSSRDGGSVGSESISVSQGSPSIVFYKNDPLYGPLFNSALGNILYLGSEREAGILAVPYGFNVPATGIGNLSFTWLINGTEHSELATKKSITARAPDAESGSSNIRLTINNTADILQEASAALSVSWNAVSAQNAGSLTPSF